MTRSRLFAAAMGLAVASASSIATAAPCPIRQVIGSWQMAVVQTDQDGYIEHLTCFLDVSRRGRDQDNADVTIDCKNMCVGCGSWYSEPHGFELLRSQGGQCDWRIPGSMEMRFTFRAGAGIAQGELGLVVAGESFYAHNTASLIKISPVPLTRE